MKKIQSALVAVILALFGMRLGTAQDQKPAMSFFVNQPRARQWGKSWRSGGGRRILPEAGHGCWSRYR